MRFSSPGFGGMLLSTAFVCVMPLIEQGTADEIKPASHMVSPAIAPSHEGGALSLNGWRVEGGVLEERDGGAMLRVQYDNAAGSNVRLLPRQPLTLPIQTTRLNFWFARLSGDFTLMLELRDATGDLHLVKTTTSRMTSEAVMWDSSRRRDWSMWNKADSIFLREPTQEALTAQVLPENRAAAEKLRWAGPLVLNAIVIRPAASAGWHAPGADAEVKGGRGGVMLASLGYEITDGFSADTYWYLPERNRSARDGTPILFADDLSSLRGKVRYSLELRKGYFGPVVWLGDGDATIDPARPEELFQQRIKLPTLAPGRYFLHTRAWRPDNTLEREQPVLTVWIAQQKKPADLRPTQAPFAIEAGVRDNVFPEATTLAPLSVRATQTAWANAPAEAVCRVQVLRSDKKMIYTETFQRNDPIAPKIAVEAGEDYFALAEIVVGDRTYDRAHLHFGVASPQEPAGKVVPDEVPDRDALLNGRADYTGEYWYGARARTYPWFSMMEGGSEDGLADWMRICRQSGVSVFAVSDRWSSHEMLPGVFSWREVERQIRLAQSNGLTVQFGYSADGNALGRAQAPFWTAYELSRDQNGDLYPDPSFWSPDIRNGYRNYYHHLAARFLNHPGVSGYRIRTFNLRAPGYADVRLDYSAPAQAAFAKWAAQNGRDAKAMGRFLAFPGEKSPQTGPDLSAEWSNFVDFCSYAARTSALDQMQAIRTSDPKRLVIVDQKPFPYAVETLIPSLRDGGVLKNEDSPAFGTVMLRSLCEQAGVPYVEELHNHLPTSRSISDATNFWNSYHSRSIFWLLRGRPEIIKDTPVVATKDSWNQNTERWVLKDLAGARATWEEWIQARPQTPQVLVFGSRAQGLLGNRRIGADFDIGGLEVYSALICGNQVLSHFCDEYTDWVDLNKFRIVFAAGEVMSERAIERLSKFAKEGGQLVLVGKAGSLCPQTPSLRDVLHTRLAGAAHVHAIPAPERITIPGVQEWAAPYVFPTDQLQPLLDLAGVIRPVEARAEASLGFETQIRYGLDGKTVYVAAMRRWAGWYWNNIERESTLKEKYGTLAGTLVLRGLEQGTWRVEKIHRRAETLADIQLTSDEGIIPLAPALAGEVQIFRLVRKEN